jgi:pilus assembly protein Flp/PilA
LIDSITKILYFNGISRGAIMRQINIMRRRRAATAIEYGLIATLISVAIFAAVQFTGVQIGSIFGRLGQNIAVANGGGGNQTVTVTGGGSQIPPTPFIAAAEATPLFCGNLSPSSFGFASGTIITSNSCAVDLTQPELFADINADLMETVLSDGPFLYNPSGGALIVPALGGSNTGFTVPGDIGAFVELTNTGFLIEDTRASLTAANTASAQTACSAEGGSFLFSATQSTCTGVTLTNIDTNFGLTP